MLVLQRARITSDGLVECGATTDTYPGNTKIFNNRNFIACEPMRERLGRDFKLAHLAGQAVSLSLDSRLKELGPEALG